MSYTEQEILNQLDQAAKDFIFPMLDNGYDFHGDQKLTIFRDQERWALMIEVLVYNNHEDGVDGIRTIADTFGNCIQTIELFDNDNFFFFTKDHETDTFLSDRDEYSFLNPNVKSILVKEVVLPVNTDPQFYTNKGIDLEYENKITPWEFLRGLIPEHSHLFWVTRQEITRKIPADLPELMTLYEWYHPDLANEIMPSHTETFRQLAKVIATGNIDFYAPTEPSNTHWSNWPEGGQL